MWYLLRPSDCTLDVHSETFPLCHCLPPFVHELYIRNRRGINHIQGDRFSAAVARRVHNRNRLYSDIEMIKRLHIIFLSIVLPSIPLFAQENILERILETNVRSTVTADFVQITHSPMLNEDLRSEGVVYLQQPDKIRWDILGPEPHTTVFNGDKPNERRFRLPSHKDFTLSEIKNNELCFVTLVPVRSDLKRLFTRIILQVYQDSLIIKEIQMFGRNGDYTVLQFHDIKFDKELSPELFNKE